MNRLFVVLAVLCFPPSSLLAQGEVPAATPAELAKLQWMVGSWVHESEGAVVKMTAEWSENRQFLLREFEIKLGGAEVMQIRQTLYWDPVAKELRSSGFMSDGSFETGLWVVDGKLVHNQRKITYPDGKQGTAINTWEVAGEGQCVFTSTARRIEGEKMPNIAPTELERKK